MLKGWRIALASVPAAENYGSAVNGATAPFSFQSASSARDVEVAFTYNNNANRIYLRFTGGVAIMFDFASSYFYIKMVSGLTESAYDATTSKTMHDQGAGLTNGAAYVFGVSGFDIYVKQNGTEIVRFKSIHHCQSGQVCCKEPLGQTRAAGTVTWKYPATLYSDVYGKVYDIRDFGAKSTTTTGSISASSTTLAVASASHLAVGDWVIVEIGTESGAGARGTKGVGGTWPALSYANAAARTADSGQANNTFAWQEDTGECWRWVSSAWTQPFASSYYLAKAVPRALHAQITAISGADVTLSIAATVTATNANVYVDCTPAINLMLYHIWYKFGGTAGNLTSFTTAGSIVHVPAGTWYVGGRLELGELGENFRIRGVGATSILKSPNGVPSAMIAVTSHDGGGPSDLKTVVSDLKMIGNCRDSGFGLAYATKQKLPYGSGSSGFEWSDNTGFVSETAFTQGSAFPSGILMSTCTYCKVTDVDSVDIFQKSVGASSSTDCWAYDCTTLYTEGLRQYIQWGYQWANTVGGGIVRCDVQCDELVSGIEIFGGDGGVVTDCTTRNASFAFNGSGGYTVSGCTIVVEASSYAADGSFSLSNKLIDINTNIGVGFAGDGGTISNCTITQQGYVDGVDDLLTGIVVNASNPNITITGCTITNPDFVVGGQTGFCPINSSGSNTDVINTTVVGKSIFNVTGSSYRNIHLTGGGGSSATGCTAGDIYVNP